MKTYSGLLLVFLFLLTSCNENRVFEEHTDPSGNLEWMHDQVVKFDVDIQDVQSSYNITLALRYAHGFMYTTLPVEVKMTAPGGAEEITQHVFQVRNEDGSSNGEGAGDIWDLENMFRENFVFPEKGVYHYEIRQISDREKMHMVMEVGLIVDKVVNQP